MPPKPPSQALDQFLLRLPPGMREKIGVAARANNRTMNAEVVSRLEQSFAGGPVPLVKANSAEADMIWEMSDTLRAMQSEFRELKDRLPPRSKTKRT